MCQSVCEPKIIDHLNCLLLSKLAGNYIINLRFDGKFFFLTILISYYLRRSIKPNTGRKTAEKLKDLCFSEVLYSRINEALSEDLNGTYSYKPILSSTYRKYAIYGVLCMRTRYLYMSVDDQLKLSHVRRFTNIFLNMRHIYITIHKYDNRITLQACNGYWQRF